MAHLDVPVTPGESLAYCAAFQLAWQALSDHLGVPQLSLGPPAPPAMVESLNARPFPRRALDGASYVALAGRGKDDIFERARAEVTAKFGSGPTLPAASLDKEDLAAIACLRKNVTFDVPFARLADFPVTFEGSRKVLDMFGVDETVPQKLADEMLRQVTVAHVGSPDAKRRREFILRIAASRGKEEVLLACVNPGTSLRATVESVVDKADGARGERMTLGARVMIPRIRINVVHRFDELVGAPLIGVAEGKAHIGEAIESLQFALDRSGVSVQAEARIVVKGEASENSFMLNRPFLIAVREVGNKEPYAVMWVGNDEALVPR